MTETAAWRLLPYDVGSSARHFALSDALTRLAGPPTVWWHSTPHPTIILGTAQGRAQHIKERALALGLHVVQRRAGGTTVLATEQVLGLDVALPRDHPMSHRDVVEAYRWLGGTWAEALRDLGIDTGLVSIEQSRAQTFPSLAVASILKSACFGTLSPYEVVVGERKLVGLAQVRRERVVLLQSGIHLRLDAETLASVLAPDHPNAARELRQRATGLDELSPRPIDAATVISAWDRALETRYGITLRLADWTPRELALADEAMA